MVLAVGARLSGQASCSTRFDSTQSACEASVEPGRPVIATSVTPRRLSAGRIAAISSLSPELESASTMSPGVTMPRSPWLASPGCTNIAGVPVEASVAAILRPTWPLLPMPITTTRPRPFRIACTTRTKLSPCWSCNCISASASMRRVWRAMRSTRSASKRGGALAAVAAGMSVTGSGGRKLNYDCRILGW